MCNLYNKFSFRIALKFKVMQLSMLCVFVCEVNRAGAAVHVGAL